MSQLLVLPLVVLAGSASASISGSGVIRSESREVSAFDSVSASGGLELKVRKGDKATVKLEGDDNLLPLVVTEVSGGQLKVHPKADTSLRPSKGIKVELTLPSLKAVEASGGVTVAVEAPTDADFKVDLSGGVELTAASLSAKSVTVKASGGVDLTLAGKADRVAYDTSGGVKVKADKLVAQDLTVDASGGCTLRVAASRSVEGTVSGGVDVSVAGNPAKRQLKRSGGSDVEWLKE